jgi:hypothetical protein
MPFGRSELLKWLHGACYSGVIERAIEPAEVLLGLTKHIAYSYSEAGICANTVCPRIIESKITSNSARIGEKARQKWTSSTIATDENGSFRPGAKAKHQKSRT